MPISDRWSPVPDDKVTTKVEETPAKRTTTVETEPQPEPEPRTTTVETERTTTVEPKE